jgi:hypothetical protein
VSQLNADPDVAFLIEAARYFEGRPTGGEDRAHWSNVYNAENCRRIAKRLGDNPTSAREVVDAVADAILRIMPYADGREAKAFIASLNEELYASGVLVAAQCSRCDDTGTKDHAGFAMDACDNQHCRFGREHLRRRAA